jgi:patatin-like phospholipase/acyl hydrolase
MAAYTIIAFNGGGIRGLMSNRIIVRLVEKYPFLLENTQMYAGTSVGASLAAHFANGGKATEFGQWMENEGARVMFAHPGSDTSKPAFKNWEFVAAQKLLFGDKILADLPKKIVLTSFQVAGGTPWTPVMFNNFTEEGGIVRIVDAVVGSGSMPGMFGSHKGYIDGAFVNHDPTLVAIAFAVWSGVSLQDIAVLDIGTGFMAQSIPADQDTAEWGTDQWQTFGKDYPERLPPLLINGSASPILNVSLNGTSTNTTAMIASLMLGDRFINVNPTLDTYVSETDIQKIPYLMQVAEDTDLLAAEALIEAFWQ